MKKLFVILTAVALVWAFTGQAAAVDWNFYGSARMATYWSSTEVGKGSSKSETSELVWAGQNNSRIGATVKGEDVSGRFELGFTGQDGADWDIGGRNEIDKSGDGIQVRARRLQGDWKFGAGTLSVGKGYTATNQFISGQVARGDGGLLGSGFNYAFRPYFVGLSFGGFEIQFIDPTTNLISGLKGTEASIGPVTITPGTSDNGDAQFSLPKIEAAWGMAFDTFNFKIRGGVQTYEIKDVTSSVDGSTDDIDVTSYIIGGDGNFNFGPVRLGFGVAISENGGDASWTAGGSAWDGDDDVDDTTTTMAGVVLGFKMSDMVSFEGGLGYTNTDPDASGVDDTDTYEIYVQSVIGLAPGVYIIPEVGFRDIDAPGSASDSSDWYLGGKWQIDF